MPKVDDFMDARCVGCCRMMVFEPGEEPRLLCISCLKLQSGVRPSWQGVPVAEKPSRCGPSPAPSSCVDRSSLWQQHIESWRNCERCPLCATRRRICLARGTVPCDVLFVGEAPGVSENELGLPFVGPAGRLLDRIIRRAFEGFSPAPSFALTNVLACMPVDPDTGEKAADPMPEEIDACRPRLEEFVLVADGDEEMLKLIVLVGTTARDAFDEKLKRHARLHRLIPTVACDHPAFILRKPTAVQGLLVQRAVVTIRNAWEDLGEAPEVQDAPR